MAEQARTNNPLQTALVGLLVVAAFLVGSLWTKVRMLESGGGETKNQVSTKETGEVAGEAAQQAPQKAQPTLDQVKALFKEGNIMFGDASRKVLFVEFTDPSCPWCQVATGKNPEIARQALGARYEGYIAAVPEMRKLVETGQAGYVWFYRRGHGNGDLAAQLFYCANDYGQFWNVHDRLMTNEGYNIMNGSGADTDQLTGLMALLNDVENNGQIQKCVEEGRYEEKLAQDMTTGDQMGAGGTPHFIMNTTVFAGAASYGDMKAEIDKALR